MFNTSLASTSILPAYTALLLTFVTTVVSTVFTPTPTAAAPTPAAPEAVANVVVRLFLALAPKLFALLPLVPSALIPTVALSTVVFTTLSRLLTLMVPAAPAPIDTATEASATSENK